MSMYLEHFGLTLSPFSTAPDPEFAYELREHRMAVIKIAYSIAERSGLFLLLGEIGTGKTTISHLLLNDWNRQPDSYAIAHISDPSATTPAAFLRTMLIAFGQPVRRNLQDLKDGMHAFLVASYRADKTVVLMIDEAQTIRSVNLDLLQMLSNEQSQKAKLIQIILFAQPSFMGTLVQKPALRSRITGGTSLHPLTQEDTLGMLRFRMSVAGGDFDRIFRQETHTIIHEASRGIPRDLCVLCDTALINAFAFGRATVDLECLDISLRDLGFKGFSLPQKQKKGEIIRTRK